MGYNTLSLPDFVVKSVDVKDSTIDIVSSTCQVVTFRYKGPKAELDSSLLIDKQLSKFRTCSTDGIDMWIKDDDKPIHISSPCTNILIRTL